MGSHSFPQSDLLCEDGICKCRKSPCQTKLATTLWLSERIQPPVLLLPNVTPKGAQCCACSKGWGPIPIGNCSKSRMPAFSGHCRQHGIVMHKPEQEEAGAEPCHLPHFPASHLGEQVPGQGTAMCAAATVQQQCASLCRSLASTGGNTPSGPDSSGCDVSDQKSGS